MCGVEVGFFNWYTACAQCSLLLLGCLDENFLIIWLVGADVKSANQKQRNERLNRALQNFLYSCISSEGEAAAKSALAVLTELWRRQVWRDARTANVIGELTILS